MASGSGTLDLLSLGAVSHPYLWPFPCDGFHLGFLAQLMGAQGLNTGWEHMVFKEALLSQAPLFENDKILPLKLEGLCDSALSISPVPLPDHTITEESWQHVGHGDSQGVELGLHCDLCPTAPSVQA